MVFQPPGPGCRGMDRWYGKYFTGGLLKRILLLRWGVSWHLWSKTWGSTVANCGSCEEQWSSDGESRDWGALS
jgi:hypothetical protein